jgi:hypothetical protein
MSDDDADNDSNDDDGDDDGEDNTHVDDDCKPFCSSFLQRGERLERLFLSTEEEFE